MKVLWVVNTIFPYPAKKINNQITVYGGWLTSLFDELEKKDELELAIVSPYKGKELKTINSGKTIYYLIPCNDMTRYDKKLEKLWKEVINNFNPELVHIHGSEYVHSIPLIRSIEKKVPVVLSIQGLIHVIEKVYLANIKRIDIIKNITIRDILKRDSILQQKRKFFKRGAYEKELLKKVDYVIGRTNWDYKHSKEVNPKLKYYKNNESLRNIFYENKWDIKNIERNTIFYSQATYPIKGLHFVLQALALIKKEIPYIKLKIAGTDILRKKTFKDRIKTTGYAKYISSLIKEYKLEENVIFKGTLTAEEMCNEYLAANVFVQASAIENSPNSLGEAMLLGVPCVASNVGGTSDMLTDKKEGLLYKYTEVEELANNVLNLLKNDNEAIKLGQNARLKAQGTHDKENNVNELISIYNKIMEEN